MDSPTSSKSLLDLDERLKHHGVHLEVEQKVCWNKANGDHPRNWGNFSKYYAVVLICWLELFMTGISTSGVSLSFRGLSLHNLPC